MVSEAIALGRLIALSGLSFRLLDRLITVGGLFFRLFSWLVVSLLFRLIGFLSRNYGSLDFCFNAPDYSVSVGRATNRLALIGFNKTLTPQIRENDASIFFRGVGDCFQCDLGMLGWLVRIINAGKVFDLAQSRLGVKAFGIPPFAFFQGSINENLHETINSDHASNFISC